MSERKALVRIITTPTAPGPSWVEREFTAANIEREQRIREVSREIAGEICTVLEVRHPRGRSYANPARVTVEIIIAEALKKGARK